MTDEHTNASHESDYEQDPDKTVKSSPVPVAPSHNGSGPNHPPGEPTPSVPAPVYVPRSLEQPPPLMRESAARERVRKRHAQNRRPGGEWAWVIIALAVFGVVIIMSLSLYMALRASTEQEPVVMPTAVSDLSVLPTAVSYRTEADAVAEGQRITLDDGYSLVLEPWDGDSRLTMLLMGIDRRPGETGLNYRTDTMMLISLDPTTNEAGILSIPRDLYIQVPGYSALQRINTPMVLGEQNSPGGGPQLAMQTVQYNLGIPVHGYAVVDFRAVITLVDVLGGIEVTTDYVIDDRRHPDLNYGYDPFYLPPGTHLLNGYDALRFARTRSTAGDDFARAQRQQQVLYAVRDRVLEMDMLPQLIIQAPSMLTHLSENIQTDLSLEQIIRLAWYAKDIPEENIKTGTISQSYVSRHFTSSGEDVLIPNRGRINNLMVEVFGSNYAE